MLLFCFLCAGAASAASTVAASTVAASSLPDAVVLEEVVVTGRRPGPPLWRVTSQDSTLWVFGLVSPLPRTLKWDEASLSHLLDGAGGLLLPPTLSMSTSNPLRALGMLRRFNAAKKLPKGVTLQSVLAPETLELWLEVAERYGLKARRYQRLRPLFAGEALLDDALASIGLETDERLLKAIKRLAKRHDVELISADVGVDINEGLGYFESISPANSQACFQAVLGALDKDVAASRGRAIAWADGDAAGLAVTGAGKIHSTCRTTPLDGAGAADARLASRMSWLDSAEALLRGHEVSLAVLPVEEILSQQGLLADLKSRGYEVRGQGISNDSTQLSAH